MVVQLSRYLFPVIKQFKLPLVSSQVALIFLRLLIGDYTSAQFESWRHHFFVLFSVSVVTSLVHEMEPRVSPVAFGSLISGGDFRF